MKEKIRVLTEGKRLVLIVEDTTPADIELIKNVIGSIALTTVENIVPNPPSDIHVPNPQDIPQEIEGKSEKEQTPTVANTDISPTVFTRGRHKGKTLDYVMKEDVSYCKWMAEKEFPDFKWSEFIYFKNVWLEKSTDCPLTDLVLMVQTLDFRPGVVHIEPQICEGLGISTLSEIKNEIDINFVRDVISECLSEI